MAKNGLSDAVGEYAAATGMSRRTAQRHAKDSHPDFIQFLASGFGKKIPDKKVGPTRQYHEHQELGQGNGLEDIPPCAPPAFVKAEDKRTVEEHAEVTSWLRYHHANRQAEILLKTGAPLGAVFSRTAAEALESYQKARQKRVAAEIESRRLVPVQEWLSFKATVTKLANLIMSIRDIAARANPQSPAVAAAAMEEFFDHRFNPALADVMQESDSIIESAGLRIISVLELDRLTSQLPMLAAA